MNQRQNKKRILALSPQEQLELMMAADGLPNNGPHGPDPQQVQEHLVAPMLQAIFAPNAGPLNQAHAANPQQGLTQH